MKKSRIYIIITIIALQLLGVKAVAASEPTVMDKIRKDLANFATLKKKLDKRPDDILLQNEAITTLGHAAFRVQFNEGNTISGVKLDMSQAEKLMIFYTYSQLLTSVRPHHNEIPSYAGYVFKAADMDTYDMKLISAEAQLMYAEFEKDLSSFIHRLRLTHEMLQAMQEQPISLAPDVEQYRKWTSLDVSDANRSQLLSKVEQLLNSYSAETYYETANTMLNYWLWRNELNLNIHAAKRHLDTYYYAKEKAKALGYPDADCPIGRYNEHEGDNNFALLVYRMAAKAGGIDGKLNAARLIIEDSCSSQNDYSEAYQLLNSAQQHPLFPNKGGEALLGYMYEYGLGVSQNDSIALHHYSLAYQAMRIQKGIQKGNNYERKLSKENRIKLENINASINRLLNRIQSKLLIQYSKSIESKTTSSDEWLMVACRFYLSGDNVNGEKYMKLAAAKGSKDAKSILDWHRKSPKYSIKNIIQSTIKSK